MKTIHSSLLLITAIAIGLLAHAASGATATWNVASGNWSNNLNWNPIIDPNGASFDVVFNNGASLTLDSARNVNTYNQTGGTFGIVSGQSLILNGNCSLAGGGAMNLGYSYLYEGASNVVFTVTNGTIQGFGEVGYNGLSLTVQANGIVSANISGQTLNLNGGGTFINNGLLRATSGGILRVLNDGSGVGTIRSENGSNVSLESRIVGGTLDNAGSTGTITLAGNGTLRDVTIATGSIVNDSNGRMENTLINHGTLTNFGSQSLYVATNTNLSGGGAVQLGYGYLYDSAANVTLTNTDNTLRGYGEIGYSGLNVINGSMGVIQADVAGQQLRLNGGGTFTNNGLIRALNGGTLIFSGSADVANNATVRSENGSDIQVQTRIIGGTLDNAGSTGTINLNSGTLRNVTVATGSTVNNTGGRLENTLINRGALTTTGSQTLFLAANTTLSGGGALQFGYGYLYDGTAGVTLTNTDNTLRGYGEIGYSGLNVINSSMGVIQADVAGQPLRLNGGGTFTNNGLIRALNGGTLIFSGSADVANNATVRSENGSDIQVQTRIIGGTLDNAGSTGTINLNSGTLRNVTVATGSTVNNTGGRLENTLINRGAFTTSGSQTLFLAANTTLSGGGSIQLGYGYLYDLTPGSTLTNTDNTLRGYGEIGYSGLNVVNDKVGIIQGDTAGQTLALNGGGSFTNNAVFKAINGGTLAQVGTLTNLSGTTLNGGFYNVTSTGPASTLSFGASTITTNNANVVLQGANSVFNAINSIQQNFGTFGVLGGRSFSTASDLANAGTIKLDENSAINVTGNYSQGTNSRLYIEIGSNGPNPSFHVLNATGSAAVAGTLDVRLVNGFVPGPTQTYTIINAGSRTGGFTQVHGADVTYTPTSVIIHPNGSAIPLVANTAVSRKVHGTAGTFDLNLPFGGPVAIECRSGGASDDHKLVFTFNNDVASGNASVTAGTGSVSGSPTFLGNTMTVNLTGVTNAQTLAVTLGSVTDTFGQVLPATPVSIGFLIGDTNGNGLVNSGDTVQTRGRSGQTADATNFRSDVNADGTINSGDQIAVRSRSGTFLP